MKDIIKYENYLYNSLEYIVTNNSPIKKTNDYVYGKRVLIPVLTPKGYETEEYELENWYITLPCSEKTDIATLVDCFKAMASAKDNPFAKTWEELKNYTCHQLCDWQWLTNDCGEIIQNGKATLVKYAIILKDKRGN